MYYDKQPLEYQNNYKMMLKILGSLSRIFSAAPEPYLYYRAHENIFSKYFHIANNARSDDSADAYDLSTKQGIGLKTWVGQDNQKVAEFGKLRPIYEHLEGIDLIKQISEYRNTRIRTTMNVHGLNEMLYHIVKRIPNAMCIYEASFDYINIDNITIDENRGNANSIYFTDGKHTYHFSLSKNTLYMIFDEMQLLDTVGVEIADDPYELLTTLLKTKQYIPKNINSSEPRVFDRENQLCLRLYTKNSNGQKVVAEKSGLNQWNGARNSYKYNSDGTRELTRTTPRDPDELYIPYPAEDRNRKVFFPPRNVVFDLELPDGQLIKAKVCQDNNKAIMSNPNKDLGKWLLRDIFELEEGTVVTYQMLQIFGIDSVIFTKLGDTRYSVDFCEVGTYEKFYGLEDD